MNMRFLIILLALLTWLPSSRAAQSFTVNGNHAVNPTNLALPGWLSVTNPITNAALTASTILKANTGKGLESIQNPLVPSVLTNDLGGPPEWMPISSLAGGGGGSNYLFDTTQFNVGGGSNVAIKANALTTNLNARGLTVTIGQTNSQLTASKIMLTGASKESVSSAFGESDLASFAAIPTNIFNPNQFTQLGVGGTNVNISNGAIVTNFTPWGLHVQGTNLGGFTATNPAIYFQDLDTPTIITKIEEDGSGGFRFVTTGGVIVLDVDDEGNFSLGAAFNPPIFPSSTPNTIAYFNSDQKIDSVTDAKGILHSDNAGIFSFLPLSVFSNNVLLTETPTNFDFYGFLKFTNASGKVSIGAPDISTGSSNSYTFDTTQFTRTGVGGTNIAIKSGALFTNVLTIASNNVLLTASPTQVDFYGFTLMTNSNNKVSIGAPTVASSAGPTNAFDTTQFSVTGALGTNVAIKSGVQLTNAALFGLTTNNGSMNTAGGVTNYSTTRHVGGVENQSTTTNSSWVNNGGTITNFPASTTTIPQYTTLDGGHNADAFAIMQGPSKVGGFDSNGLAWFYPSNATVVYPACYRIFNQTADGSCTNITTVETSWFGTGVGSLTLPAGFWKVGRSVRIEMSGQHWTGTPLNNLIQLKLGTKSIATNMPITLISSLVAEMFEADFILTCRTNSATVGYIQAQGKFNFPTAAGGGIYGFRFMKSTLPIFDTTAAMAIDVTSTNGASTTSFMIKDAIVTVLP